MRRIDEIIIHCAATRPSQDIGVKEIRQWHLNRNYSDIGYHFVIRRDGTVENGRPITKIGAHTKGHNTGSIGICLVGGVTEQNVNVAENNFTSEQFDSLYDLVKNLKEGYSIGKISGHNEYANKACPSFDIQEWRNAVNL